MTSSAGIRAATLATLAVLLGAGLAEARPRAGSLDKSFGRNGRLVVDLPGERMRLAAMTVRPDGSILLGGHVVDEQDIYAGTFSSRALVIRLRPDGERDETFGNAGVARVPLPHAVAIGGIAVQPDGAILLSGTARPANEHRSIAAVVRLSPSGAADESFGDRGLATIEPENLRTPEFRNANPLTELGVHPDGRIVATGSQLAYDVHASADPLVVRLLPNGAPDPSFDENGVSSIGGTLQTAILRQADGALVALGWDHYYFGNSGLTALRVPPAATDLPLTAPLPSNVFTSYRWHRAITALAARPEPDGSILYATRIEPREHRNFLGWIRIGPDLELLERGRRRAPAGAVGTFDSRGALLTADPAPNGGPIELRRFRGRRFRTDGSFGWPARQPEIAYPTELIGMEIQGANKVLLAGYTGTRPPADAEPEPITLFRLHAHQDGRGPVIRVHGLPHRGNCATGTLDPLVRIRDESRVRSSVRLDRRTLSTRRRKRFRTEIDTSKLRPGPHKLMVSARDAAGNLGRVGTTFRVCARG